MDEDFRKRIIKVIKKNKSFEKETRKLLVEFAEKNKLGVGEVFDMVMRGIKDRCSFNFFGCNDVEGHNIAYGLDEFKEATGIEDPVCSDICGKGCCAHINQILMAIQYEIFGVEHDNPDDLV